MRASFDAKEHYIHPVDVIEQIVHHRALSFERLAEDEISLSIRGQLSDYHVTFSWAEIFETLHIGCAFTLSIVPKQRPRMVDLLSLINEKMLEQKSTSIKSPSVLMGHFDYWQDTGEVIYRQNLLLSSGRYPTDAQITTLLSTALDACELHFPACEKVAMSDISAYEALRYAMFETLGHA